MNFLLFLIGIAIGIAIGFIIVTLIDYYIAQKKMKREKVHEKKELSDEEKEIVIGTREGLFLDAFHVTYINSINSYKNKESSNNNEKKEMMKAEYSSLREYLRN